jgi:4,5-dihydroxyphthalate decarboxylase
MSDLRLSLAISDYIHTADLVNGRVRPVGIDFTIVNLPFEAVTMRFGANLEFDVAEFSLANYCALAAERCLVCDVCSRICKECGPCATPG